MKNEHINKDYFIRLFLAEAEHVSSSVEAAKEYLTEEGIDVDKLAKSGAAKIMALQRQKHSTQKLAVAKVRPLQLSETLQLQGRGWHHPSVLRLIIESGNPDPMDEIKSRARDTVIKAFAKGWQGPPYNPIELATIMGFQITPQDQVVDACIQYIGKGYEIQYNPFQRSTRTNFSIAHEIAHTFFSDCADALRNREEEPVENRELEQLCNAGAAEIQLPYAIFSHDANKAEPTMKGLIELATRYQASLESVFIRYTEVVDIPCVILIGIFQSDNQIVVDYYKASRSFPFDLPSNFEIPQHSKVYECVSRGWTSEEPAEWSFFAGHGYRAFAAGISAYRRDDKPRVGVLVVPNRHVPTSGDSGKVVLEFGDATKPRGKGKKIIAQVVNTGAALGRGFGLALTKNYPIVKTELDTWKKDKGSFRLGETQLVKVDEQLYVFQMLAQKGVIPKGDETLLQYAELRKCLIALRKQAQELKASIHMNAIGSGQAGGDWNIIIGMIHDELVNYDLKVNIYLLPGKPINTKQRSSLTVFKEDSTWGTEK